MTSSEVTESAVQAEVPATDTVAAVAPAPHFVRHHHDGVEYLALLSAMHRALKPTTYLEIGTDRGDSLRLARCASIAVDPKFKIGSDVIGEKPMLAAFQTASDAFFRERHVAALFPGGIDLAFLDGMHLFEYLLRDFIYVEQHAHWRSVVVLHDCLPPNIEIAERDYRPHLRTDDLWRIYWTGDVWKVLPILRQYRPDLRITLFDTPPSGLVMISGMDSRNTVLRDSYTAILDAYRDRVLDETSFREFYASLTITPSKGLIDGHSLSAFV